MDEPERNEPQNRGIEIKAVNSDEEFYIGPLSNEILCIIFQNLNSRDLSRAAMVCRKWSENANREKGIRRGPYFFKTRYVSATDKKFDFACIKKSPIKPFVGFFFIHSLIHKNNHNMVKDAICQLLPTNCKTIILFTHIISLNKHLIQYQKDNPYFMVCAFLPQISNVELNMVIVQDEMSYIEYAQMIERASRQNPESFMCLMLFYDLKVVKLEESSDLASRMAEIAKSTFDDKEKVSLCGVAVPYLRTNNETDQRYCVALLITGSIKTWSIVLEEETWQSSEEKLRIFKEQVLLQKYTVGFVFFSERSVDVHKELTIFKELFPNIPLVGCSSLFKFGSDTYKAEYLRQCSKQSWNIQSSTTFMILTYE